MSNDTDFSKRPSQDRSTDNTLRIPPSSSTLSMKSDKDDASTGYITASSSRVSHLEREPLTALPRIHLESTPLNRSSPPAPSPSTESITTIGENSSNDTSRANKFASISSVTTFVPSTSNILDLSDEEDDSDISDPDRDGERSKDTEEHVQKWDFDLRDPHERTLEDLRGQDEEEDEDSRDQTLNVREAQEGDVITVSHSHSTSINTAYPDLDSIPHSRASFQPDSAPHYQHTSFPMALSASWPSIPSIPNMPSMPSMPRMPTLPQLHPSAVKLHRRRRSLLLRLLKTWEGREQVLHLSHSLVLLLYSSLDHPVPQTYRGAMLRPAGTALAMSFPKPIRVALMQRIYTTAEGIDNFRRVILIARWISAASEAVMEHWQQRMDKKRRANRAQREQLEIKLTGDEPIDKPSDHVEGGFAWLQPPSIRHFDAAENADEGESTAEQSFTKAPAAKLGKVTGRGDATGAVGADVAENADAEKCSNFAQQRQQSAAPSSSSIPASLATRAIVRLWSTVWKLSHLSFATETLATVGEACETAAVFAGGGMFWRAVGIQRLGLPLLSRRRRQGIERLGIVVSLCSVLVSLLVLRMERKVLRSELRSAHRRIIRANDKLGWASDLVGATIDRDQALSYRKKDPAKFIKRRRASKGNAEADKPLEMLGADLEAAARDLDDQELDEDGLSLSNSSLESGFPDDPHPNPTSRSLYSFSHHYPQHRHHEDARGSLSDKYRHEHGPPKPVAVSSLIKATERCLVRAESDLTKTKTRLRLNFWEKIANCSETIFLIYEAARPQVDKEGVEGWTGLVASAIRLSGLWKQLGSN
ncbi:uncharacterized protein MEPE_05131 [Melanopsichium pennsylvanicum]|uniref:Uncharacterized protein n=2 Tax=Melanopsichium pennsylvanicum TaxID=63383 RepID=A0AAJ4XQ88_9BASI|nr:putative protein [Melanopsichium pennsylvanicum 4]SNX86422.1 uncharacterized protein MEPE_05131 [Melanopsichium pennsylvanicum]